MEFYNGFSRADLERYSTLKAFRELLDRRGVTGLEKEVSDELAKRSGQATGGFFLPIGIPTASDFQNRALDLTAGAGAIATDIIPKTFINYLQAKSVCLAAGATLLPGLQGNLSLPKETATVTVTPTADSAAPGSESNQTISGVSLSPKSQNCFTDISRKFLVSSAATFQADALVKAGIARAMGSWLDAMAINGSGTSNQPTGVMQAAIQVNGLGTNGGTPAWADVVGLETGVSIGNADIGSLGYLMSPKVRGLLKTTLRSSSNGYICETVEGRDYVAGNPAFATNNVPSNLTKGTGTNLSALIYGNWNDLVIAIFGEAINFTADKYSNSTTDTLRVVASMEADIAVRNLASFHQCVDIVVSSQPTS